MRGSRKRLGPAIAWLVVLLCGIALPSGSSAERTHTVREGQTVSAIARRYGVAVPDLLAANGLGRGDVIRPGDELQVPERGVVYVRPGETLSGIARDHGVSVRDLMRVNRIRSADAVRAGRRLVMPGAEAAEAVERAARRWGRPRRPGVATLVRVQTRERLRIRLVSPRGRTRSAAVRRLAPLWRSTRADRSRGRPHPRLVQNLARISDHFGGRTIYVVSGMRAARGFTRESSRHVSGKAVDFRIQGVPNTVVRDYCRTLSKVGVGYYPNSTFVHLDVRDRSAYWVDVSSAGQRPRYRRRGQAERDDGEVDDGYEGTGETELPPDLGGEEGEEGEEGTTEPAEGSDEASAGVTASREP